MPIDSDGDALDDASDSPAAADRRDSPAAQDAPETPETPGTRGSREQQIAEQIRYRHEVDAVYEVFERRQAWGEAAPKLRAAWEQLKGRYPDVSRPTPQDQPDGSWTCGEIRRLSADQNAEVTREYTRIREIGRTDIIPAVRAIEAEDPTRHLAGFANRFKGEDRLKEKVADQVRSTPGVTPAQALALIPDAVRFTLQYSDDRYTAGVARDVERFKERGFTLVESRNTWTSDQYKGINSRWQEPESGVVFEVQFHTQASIEAKELTHKAYERIRSKAGDAARDRQSRLRLASHSGR